MKKQSFVIGDIHGRLEELKLLLKKWDKENQILIFLGDYFNRVGKKGWEVIQYIKKLKETYPKLVFVIGGNHEELFLDTIEHQYMLESYLHGNIGGIKTLDNYKEIYNLEGDDKTIFNHLIEHQQKEVSFIKEMLDYKIWSKYLFVHAGVDTELDSLEYMDKSDLRNIRNEFIFNNHKIRKIVVFGHTPTQNIDNNEKGTVWISENGRKIGIDGGTQRLNAIVITRDSDLLTNYYVNTNDLIVKESVLFRK